MKLSKLSSQEKKLFYFLLTTLRMKEIACKMSLHEKTIDTYARNIYKKLLVEGRLGLLIRWYSTGKSLGDAKNLNEIEF